MESLLGIALLALCALYAWDLWQKHRKDLIANAVEEAVWRAKVEFRLEELEKSKLGTRGLLEEGPFNIAN